ncbi:MAG: ABC transporter permease [Termitinemataceae bacterium]|nr:MAG: ABC transporter permease [Termitinemataceae bacterium]
MERQDLGKPFPDGKRMSNNNFNVRLYTILSNDKTSGITIPIFCVVFALIAAVILLLALGKNPLTALLCFLQGSGFFPKSSYAGGQNILSDFLSFLGILAPMLLASLSVVVALKAGMFNIGVAGQMLASGFITMVFVGYSPLSAVIAKPLCILVGIIVGAVLGYAVGILKAKFNINEVVSTIMFNYIISYVTGFFISNYFADNITRSSKICSAASRLTLTDVNVAGLKLTVPLAMILALVAAFLIQFIFERTNLGFEIRAVGNNKSGAKYAGMNEKRVLVLTMMISGALAGLAGVSYFMGYYNTILPKSLPDMGFNAVAVAILGNLSPIGAVFSSVLITIFQKGAIYMGAKTNVPQEISQVIIALILLFSACGIYVRHISKKKLNIIQQESIPQVPQELVARNTDKKQVNNG